MSYLPCGVFFFLYYSKNTLINNQETYQLYLYVLLNEHKNVQMVYLKNCLTHFTTKM